MMQALDSRIVSQNALSTLPLCGHSDINASLAFSPCVSSKVTEKSTMASPVILHTISGHSHVINPS